MKEEEKGNQVFDTFILGELAKINKPFDAGVWMELESRLQNAEKTGEGRTGNQIQKPVDYAKYVIISVVIIQVLFLILLLVQLYSHNTNIGLSSDKPGTTLPVYPGNKNSTEKKEEVKYTGSDSLYQTPFSGRKNFYDTDSINISKDENTGRMNSDAPLHADTIQKRPMFQHDIDKDTLQTKPVLKKNKPEESKKKTRYIIW